jgi:minor extracellular serine protease Vpr
LGLKIPDPVFNKMQQETVLKGLASFVVIFVCIGFLSGFTAIYNNGVISGQTLMSADPDSVVGAFVEFDMPTVAMSSTFGGKHPFLARELMRPDNAMTKHLEGSARNFLKKHLHMVRELVPDCRIGQSYQYAFNGYFIETKRRNLDVISSLPHVAKIFSIRVPQVQRTKHRKLIGAEKVWETVKDPKGRPVEGTGELICITDTGLDYTHPDFGSQTSPVGKKVVISRDLANKDNDCQEEPSSKGMHGTACASIAAGDGPDNPVTGVKEKGVAPKALLAGYKGSAIVNGQEQFTQEAAVGSWEYVIKDKIDVSSNSWGVPGGEHEHEKMQLNCALVGCVVVCANGNYGTQGDTSQEIPQSSSGAGHSAIGVGATDDVDASFLLVTNDDGSTKKISGNWGYVGKAPIEYEKSVQLIDCLWGRSQDFKNLDCKGKIVLVERGPVDPRFGSAVPFREKLENAYRAGALAVILYNYSNERMYADYLNGESPDNPDLKMVSAFEIERYNALSLRKYIHDTAVWNPGIPDGNQKKVEAQFTKPQPRANIAEFSSNGPTKLGFLKPDVCAAGVGVHAAISRYYWKDYGSQYFETMGGTSSATPFVAGCAALVKQARPTWDPFEVKRSLMNTATLLQRTDGRYYLPFVAQGMGRVNVYEAATADVLIQPPSALIVADTGQINIADKPEEPLTFGGQNGLLGKSEIRYKIANYSDKKIELSLSIEVNSGNPSQFGIKLTDTQLDIPPAQNSPGIAWLGLSVKLPNKVKGSLNDIILWMTDRTSGKRYHTGICIYNSDPATGGKKSAVIKDFKTDCSILTPDGDGVDDSVSFSFDVTNGLWSWDYGLPTWLNQGKILNIFAIDQNGQRWTDIGTLEDFELGPASFVWNGRDVDGKNLLPDGSWKIGYEVLCRLPSKDQTGIKDEFKTYLTDVTIDIGNSSVKSPPVVSAFAFPPYPAVGEAFELRLYLTDAKDPMSLDFRMSIPNMTGVIKYLGIRNAKGNVDVSFNQANGLFDVRAGKLSDFIYGNGCFLTLKMEAVSANFLDANFSGIELTALDETGKEKKVPAFSKNLEISVLRQHFNQADFDGDGKVGQSDLDILLGAFNTKKGQSGFVQRCDLNGDLVVDYEDLLMFSKLFDS